MVEKLLLFQPARRFVSNDLLRNLFLCCLGTLRTVFGASLHSAVNALGIKSAADDVVTHTGKVLNTAAADKNDRVFLKVVADAGDIS